MFPKIKNLFRMMAKEVFEITNLSLLIKNKLGIGSFRLIGAYQDKIHVGKDPKAPLSAEL